MLSIGRQVSSPKLRKETQSTTGEPARKDEARWPSLHAFLWQKRDLGELHQTGALTLFTEGDVLKMVLNDRPCRKSVFISAQSFAELWAKADMGLESGSLNWSGAGYKRRSRVKVYK